MSENHATPQPTPKPLCAIFEPMLPLLRSDGLTVEDRRALEEHLADCAWCQNQLTTLDVVDAALRRHYTSVPAATVGSGSRSRARPALSLEDIMKADQEETDTATANREPPTPLHQLTPRQRQLTALGALAAVLVLAVLAASLFGYFGARGTGPAVKPTPTKGLDAQSQAYLNVLQTYYDPEEAAFLKEAGCRIDAKTDSDGMRTCQSFALPVVLAAQALKDHLTLTPPARWQTADAQIKQATDDIIAGFSALAAVTTVSEWSTAAPQAEHASQEYCPPILLINSELVPAGLPLSSLLSNTC